MNADETRKAAAWASAKAEEAWEAVREARQMELFRRDHETESA